MDGVVVSFRREPGAPSGVAQTVAVAELADALELCLARDDCAAVSVAVLRRAGTALEASLHRRAQVERGDELPPSRRRITYVRDSAAGYASRPIPAPPAGVQQRMTLQRATLLCDSAAPWLLTARCAGFAFEAPDATEHAANATVRVVQLARYDSAVDVADADAFGRWFFAARQEAPDGACMADPPHAPPRLPPSASPLVPAAVPQSSSDESTRREREKRRARPPGAPPTWSEYWRTVQWEQQEAARQRRKAEWRETHPGEVPPWAGSADEPTHQRSWAEEDAARWEEERRRRRERPTGADRAYDDGAAASPPPAPKRRWRRLTAAEHTERILSEGAAGPPPITAPSAATAWALRILDVVSRKQAKRAFRRLASRVHPDKSRHPAATEAMAMLTTAKQILEYYS